MTLLVQFPGQGSQSVGMLSEHAKVHALVRETFEEASDALGVDIWKVSQENPDDTLNQTAFTQPAILTASVALGRLWSAMNETKASHLVGHSLGEYSALVFANAISFAEAVRLVRTRGELMQSAVPAGSGAMAAIIGLDDETVKATCESVAKENRAVVSAVNFNAPGQVVIAGAKSAVESASEALKSAGAKRAMLLPVSVPSHCDLMKAAAEDFAGALQSCAWKETSIPVIHNVSADVADDEAHRRQLLEQQLFSPVRWVESIQKAAASGVTTAVECGPGKVLTGLLKRIDKSIQGYSIDTPESLDAALTAIQKG